MKKALALSLALLVGTAGANTQVFTHEQLETGYTYAMSCALLLGGKSDRANQQGLAWSEFDALRSSKMWIGDWAEMRAAATKYELTAEEYAYHIKKHVAEYKGVSYAAMVDAVYRGVADLQLKAKEVFVEDCLEGHREYVENLK